jgi:hypothetical protein
MIIFSQRFGSTSTIQRLECKGGESCDDIAQQWAEARSDGQDAEAQDGATCCWFQ